ncbi:hypothetical protein Tco_0149049 [Tanacetum coccineum]
MNYPLVEAFTKTPSVLYQNFLKEFWCTTVVEDPNPLEDDSEVRPLKEFVIKFIVMNGKKPLTLDYKTFCESTGLDYNKGNYVAHPFLEAVKAELAKIAINEALGTRSSKSLPEVKLTDPKDLEGNKQPADMGLPATHPDEVEPDTETLLLTIVADNQALLEDFEEELKDASDDDVFEAGEEMDEDIQELDTEETQTHHSTKTPTEEPPSTKHQSPSPHKEQPKSSKYKKTDASDSESSSCSKTFKPYDNYMPITKRQLHEEAAASYADLKWSIDDFHSTTFNQYKNTDAALRNYKEIYDIIRTDQASRLNRILENLKEVQNAVKEDPTLNKKVLEATKAYTRNSTNLSELLTLVKNYDLPGLKTIVDPLQAIVTAQNDHLAKWAESFASMSRVQDIFEIKNMMTKILCAFKGQSYSTPSSNVPTSTLSITEGPTTVGGSSAHTATITPTEETPSHSEGSVETKFTAIAFNDQISFEKTLSYEPTVSPLNDNEIDFRISFDYSDDEDYTVIYDKNSFSYKIISVDNLKTDSENDNDKVNMPLFSSPELEVNFLTEATVSPQHIDEFNLKDETSLSECNEEEENVLNFHDLFPFIVIYPNDSKSDKDNDDDSKLDKDNDDDKVDIEHSSGDLSVKPLPDVINTDVGAST